ncbi:MAG: hypothetical protein CVU56_23480 [Deltaproteobacteria bacterium HGW-Deltaproteobacteria-14]|jgi:hypothetical protein|nr:MAG: hypothetical protein CVU56_23480 [Deltaproteobacteria bacterium HGW-Deltaproteobacteria-14]
MAIAPSRRETRILATAGSGDPLLTARLLGRIHHPRALPTLLETLALWEGRKVHAVLAADDRLPLFGPNPWTDLDGHGDTPLYSLDLTLLSSIRRRRGLPGLGSFRDLHALLVREVAR